MQGAHGDLQPNCGEGEGPKGTGVLESNKALAPWPPLLLFLQRRLRRLSPLAGVCVVQQVANLGPSKSKPNNPFTEAEEPEKDGFRQ